MKKFQQQQRFVLAVIALFALSSLPADVLGFVTVQPPSTPCRRATRSKTLLTVQQAFNHNNNNNDNLGDDWNDLKRAAGSIARKVGTKALDFVEQGGSKLLSVVGQGAEKLTSALSNTQNTERSNNNVLSTPSSPFMFVDTEDEALFRNVFGEGLFPSTGVVGSIDHVVEQAASVLNQDPTVASLLGPSLRYGRPFSQSSRTITINGRTSNTVQASFQVFGAAGEGIASVVSSQNELLSLDLQVNGRLYKLNVPSSSSSVSGSGSNNNQQNVEILNDSKGFRKPFSRDGIVDAEIEEKNTFLDSDDNIFI